MRISVALLVGLCLLGWPYWLRAQETQVITARVEQWKPAFWREGGRWVGMDIDFYRALEKASGLRLRLVKLPWSRGIYKLREGSLTIMSQLSKTDERQQFIHFLGPYNHEEMVLVVHRDNRHLTISSLDDLVAISRQTRRRVGIERDSWYGQTFEARKEVDPHFMRHFEYARTTLAEMMVRKRLLGMIEQRVVIAYKIRNLPEFKPLAIHDFTFNRNEIFLGVSKKTPPRIVDRLRRASQTLMANGTFAAIEKRWKND